ncbi:MAG: EFR1 family ferrodoxin [Oscillospiraceae bacterium]|nr:EFR1 family ferrodoxin [Oscillospiraceae bacterium]
MNTTIFYFSGTGNSLFVAKNIASRMEVCTVHSIASSVPTEQIGGKDEKIGFVFPSYYGNLPRIVRRFISELNIHPDTSLFGVVTMGAPMGMGNGCAVALEQALADKGLKLRYCNGITMPRNYILKYNPLSANDAKKYNRRANKRIESIVGEILADKSMIHKSSISSDYLYKNIEALDHDFFVDERCTGCGICEKICPVSNIKIVSNRPEWKHRCEHCVACISWCPEAAIQYGEKTKKRRRYHNTDINISELLR